MTTNLKREETFIIQTPKTVFSPQRLRDGDLPPDLTLPLPTRHTDAIARGQTSTCKAEQPQLHRPSPGPVSEGNDNGKRTQSVESRADAAGKSAEQPGGEQPTCSYPRTAYDDMLDDSLDGLLAEAVDPLEAVNTEIGKLKPSGGCSLSSGAGHPAELLPRRRAHLRCRLPDSLGALSGQQKPPFFITLNHQTRNIHL